MNYAISKLKEKHERETEGALEQLETIVSYISSMNYCSRSGMARLTSSIEVLRPNVKWTLYPQEAR
mgnify:CR=1 FL=1